ncbi:hypothetical protein BG842_25075 [Haladaptatus sp. W1]|uniref:hypothetical protein n=1 Tax=Haladaptatus sp. W1 TaxID=1897478 RepID=UPI000849E5BA|nr:hypothetical protein [Haladaptatus sp. W1]ODR81727.1 hypothetical protein BG842_17790 [Haladaptatus sp. W1]ODR83500.1 hypothetical protein BG842_25075 [Haladaptatus sp. W1]
MNISTSGVVKFLLIFSLVGSIVNEQRIGALISLTLLVLWYEWREYKQKNGQGESQNNIEDEGESTTNSV